MTQQWFVGIDGSPDGCAALNWAVQMAGGAGGTVTPITAWHVPMAISIMAGRRPVEVDRLGLKAEAEVLAAETVSATADPDGVMSEPSVVEGHPAPVLLDVSGDDTCIVVGRRGISDLKHRMLGSVSQYLATHAHGPVVVVPADWPGRPCSRIIVGFDGSEHAAAALRWAIANAPKGASITALIALDVIPWLKPELVEERYPDEVEAGKRRILDAADQADPDGVAERVVVLHGARQALAEVSSDADLIVVGPRGFGGVARSILGSTTSWLLHGSPCPVAVVPTP